MDIATLADGPAYDTDRVVTESFLEGSQSQRPGHPADHDRVRRPPGPHGHRRCPLRRSAALGGVGLVTVLRLIRSAERIEDERHDVEADSA